MFLNFRQKRHVLEHRGKTALALVKKKPVELPCPQGHQIVSYSRLNL